MPTVVQTGTYSSFNAGDATMQLVCAKELTQRGVDVTIAAPFPDADQEFYAGLKVVRDRRRNLVGTIFRLSGLLACRSLPLVRRRLLREPLLRQLSETDLVIDLSGDMLTDDYGAHVAISHYLPLLLARAVGTPYVLCAQSIGPFKWTKLLARLVLRGADWISVRDDLSTKYVKEVSGVDPLRSADLSYLLEPASSARVDSLLEAEGVTAGRQIIGVSVSPLIESHYSKRNPSTKPFHAVIAGVVDSLAAELGAVSVLIPHVTGPGERKDDRLACERVAGSMSSEVVTLRKRYKPEELRGIIGRCSLFIGARMHANLSALSSGVPTVAIAYSHKSYGLMERLNQTRSVVDVAEFDQARLLQVARETSSRSSEIRMTLERATSEERELAKVTIDRLVESVGSI